MKIIIVILAAAIIFLVIRAIRLGINSFIRNKPGLSFPIKIAIVAEFLIWLVFIFKSADYLFREKFFYNYLVVTLILIGLGFLTWFIIRDMIAGVIFRVKYNLKAGVHINAGGKSGQIKSQNLTSLTVRTNDGLIVNLPYSKLVNDVITEKVFRGNPEEHILHLRIDLSSGRTNAEEIIRNALLCTPWSNLREEPSIRFVKENESGYFFEVTLFAVKMKHIKLIESALGKVPSLKVVSQKAS